MAREKYETEPNNRQLVLSKLFSNIRPKWFLINREREFTPYQLEYQTGFEMERAGEKREKEKEKGELERKFKNDSGQTETAKSIWPGYIIWPNWLGLHHQTTASKHKSVFQFLKSIMKIWLFAFFVFYPLFRWVLI